LYVFNEVVSITFSVKSEFELIHSLRSRSAVSAIGDDCAVLPKDEWTDLLITADMLIEDVDFRLQWTTPDSLGHKALAVSLSDIAAMGGKPVWAMLSLGVPQELWENGFVEAFYSGWYELAGKYDVSLVGGDISRSTGKLVIDSIVGGEVAHGKAIRRSGAQIGDGIFVTGSLGGAAGGLDLLENGFVQRENIGPEHARLAARQLKPDPQLTTANLLFSLGVVTSMIDVSDGLSSDLGHICNESAVGARIYADRLPVDRDLHEIFGEERAFAMALNGGEDLGLLFTGNTEAINAAAVAGATNIGEVTGSAGSIDLVEGDRSSPLEPLGFRHF